MNNALRIVMLAVFLGTDFVFPFVRTLNFAKETSYSVKMHGALYVSGYLWYPALVVASLLHAAGDLSRPVYAACLSASTLVMSAQVYKVFRHVRAIAEKRNGNYYYTMSNLVFANIVGLWIVTAGVAGITLRWHPAPAMLAIVLPGSWLLVRVGATFVLGRI